MNEIEAAQKNEERLNCILTDMTDEMLTLRQAEILSGNVVKQAHADGALMAIRAIAAAMKEGK
jgi:hypothetical protein